MLTVRKDIKTPTELSKKATIKIYIDSEEAMIVFLLE